ALAPSPPLAHTLTTSACTPCFSQNSLTHCSSSSVSCGNWLTATTTGAPQDFTLLRWRARLAEPFSMASRCPVRSSPGLLTSATDSPPLYFRDRTVDTTATASAAKPPAGPVILTNFSP